MAVRPHLTTDDVACWVIKTATAPSVLVPGWEPSTRRTIARCLHPTYRLELMAPGQRCLLWLSGAGAGVVGIGALTSEVRRDSGLPIVRAGDRERSRGDEGPEVDVELWLLAGQVPRDEIKHDVTLGAAEVVRVPMRSNPSFLTRAELAALCGHLDADELEQAGWV